MLRPKIHGAPNDRTEHVFVSYANGVHRNTGVSARAFRCLQEFGSNLGIQLCALQLEREQPRAIGFVRSGATKVDEKFN